MSKYSIFGWTVLALVATLLIVEAKSNGQTIHRLIGGQKAQNGQFPHQVSVSSASTLCAGVIISEQY